MQQEITSKIYLIIFMKNDLLKIDTRLPFLTCSNALSYGLRNPAKHKCEFNIGTIYYNAKIDS